MLRETCRCESRCVTSGALSNDDGDGNENGKKSNRFTQISKTTTLHVHHAFLYISLPFLHDYGVKMGDVNNPRRNLPLLKGLGEEISPKKRLTLRIVVSCHALVGKKCCVTTQSGRKQKKMTQFPCQPNIFSFPLKDIKKQKQQ